MTQNSQDLRVRRTHKLLRDALVMLIEEQRFDAITVEAITECAMVSRAAFYRHYQDKYDLVEQIFEEAFQTMIHDVEHSLTIVELGQPPIPWIKLFEHFLAYKHLYHALLGEKGSPSFQANMRVRIAQELRERIRKQMRARPVSVSDLIPTLLAGVLIDTITWWFKQEQPDPPHVIATSCYKLMFSMFKEASRWE